jgi:hypothetical protein
VIVGLALQSALVFNISKLPYSTWFKIASLLSIPTAIVAGHRLAIRPNTAGRAGTSEKE